MNRLEDKLDTATNFIVNALFIMFFVVAIALVFTSCSKDGLTKEKTNNPEYEVEFLLEHDGCKIYRFADSHYVYFTKCGDTSSEVSCGKNCYYNQQNINLKKEQK